MHKAFLERKYRLEIWLLQVCDRHSHAEYQQGPVYNFAAQRHIIGFSLHPPLNETNIPLPQHDPPTKFIE